MRWQKVKQFILFRGVQLLVIKKKENDINSITLMGGLATSIRVIGFECAVAKWIRTREKLSTPSIEIRTSKNG
jgi:cytosine/uracil/thiamine/allantoin permease